MNIQPLRAEVIPPIADFIHGCGAIGKRIVSELLQTAGMCAIIKSKTSE